MSIYIYLFGILFPFYTSCNGPDQAAKQGQTNIEHSSLSTTSDSVIAEHLVVKAEEESGIIQKPSEQLESDKAEVPFLNETNEEKNRHGTTAISIHQEKNKDDFTEGELTDTQEDPDESIEESPTIDPVKEIAETEETIPISSPEIIEETLAPVQSIDSWQKLLSKHVSSGGRVNYAGFIEDLSELNKFLVHLDKNVPERSDRSEEAKAYWINAYNAFTIKLILDNYPIKSIRDLHNGNPWDVKWIKLNDKSYSLNDIEHNILRKNWKDARIHFAVNCAAYSCPPLSNKAFTAQNSNSLLDQLSKSFINNSKFNVISSSEMSLSKIFEWYAEDFGNIAEFIDSYSNVNVSKNASISYRDYDWSLNGQ